MAHFGQYVKCFVFKYACWKHKANTANPRGHTNITGWLQFSISRDIEAGHSWVEKQLNTSCKKPV